MAQAAATTRRTEMEERRAVRGGGGNGKEKLKDVPMWIGCTDWRGVIANFPRGCYCASHLKLRRHVAFNGEMTDRGFLGCHCPNPKCSFVLWMDDPHKGIMDRIVGKMWQDANNTVYKMSKEEFEDIIDDERRYASPRWWIKYTGCKTSVFVSRKGWGI